VDGMNLCAAGNTEEGLRLIARSIGESHPTPLMRQAAKDLTHPNIALLALVLHQIKKE